MIVIKDGINFAKVYADKAFDKWGTPTTEELHIVEQWTDIDIPDTAEKIDANLPYDVDFQEYFDMIENTLWIFNNEPIKIKTDTYLTGAGINWMLQKGQVQIFDISKTQTKFISALLEEWDGKNYGRQVYDFIVKNNVHHFHCNLDEVQDSRKLLITDKQKFIDTINKNFDSIIEKYAPDWQWQPERYTVQNKNIIDIMSDVYLGKAILSNIFNFKYYYAKLYVKDAYSLLAPSTKVFIKQIQNAKPNLKQPACKKIETNIPVKDVYNEIQNIKKYLVSHRSDSGLGWSSFCIHGQSYHRTKQDSFYPDFKGHNWTAEAIQNMPRTIAWLKTLGYKNFQRVRVMCLNPKSFINLHRDQTESKLGPINVAINNPDKCKFYLQNHGVLDFKPGVAFQLDLSNFHSVVNDSNVPRYHIIIHGER